MGEIEQRVSKPKTQRGKRFLESRAPKLIENTKSAIFVRGGKTSPIVTQCLRDLYQLKKPNAQLMKRNNPFHPFEDDTVLEKFSYKYDSSLFIFGSHSKKRPHNLVIGRMYDFHVLDMFEFGVDNLKSMEQFKGLTCPMATKPCLLFSGELFQSDPTYERIKNLFIDLFRGEVVENLRLQGLELAISFTAQNDKIYMKTYRIHLKKSGSRVPRVELTEMGPNMDFKLRRKTMASGDLFKAATRQPAAIKPKAVKNVSKDVFGSRLARVHVGKQPLKRLQTRKMKGLKRPKHVRFTES